MPRSPAAAARATVRGPIVGRSARRSWPGFSTLTSTPPGPSRRSAAQRRDQRVGALDRLDAQHQALLHHHRLADIERAQRARDALSHARCRPSPARRARPAERALRRQPASASTLIGADDAEPLALQLARRPPTAARHRPARGSRRGRRIWPRASPGAARRATAGAPRRPGPARSTPLSRSRRRPRAGRAEPAPGMRRRRATVSGRRRLRAPARRPVAAGAPAGFDQPARQPAAAGDDAEACRRSSLAAIRSFRLADRAARIRRG